MFNYLRSLVSENRKRYIDKDTNLDLSYITDRIIAMSYPSEGFEGFYRNSFIKVKQFLDGKHAGHYKVYNLRSEKQYDLARFECAANYPFLDHQAPPFSILVDFCIDASGWLRQNEGNVVAIHCKAGKGRTGTVIAALLLHLKLADNAAEAIELYGRQRTENLKGMTIPSQVRYVHYYDFMLKHPSLYETNMDRTKLTISQIVIHDLPTSLKHNREFVYQIRGENEKCVYQRKSNESNIHRTLDTILIQMDNMPLLSGDFRLIFINVRIAII
ncbi:MAG: putative phosphatidylinositol-3,4,5-trisphosphate 3-phosphatase [Benjaminiella poitrasii]|nr:MAG: putative phosphatidylinositol-3,4,5-trisphosphate 3-phosphatase [Benjaminiella poitrasii]